MKTWRVVGLVWASLVLSLTGCGSDGAGTENSNSSARTKRDAGLDAGDDEVDEGDGEDEDAATEPVAEPEAAPAPGLDANMSCEPKSCKEQGYDCGAPDDGCGGPLNCGTCKSGTTCGGGGKAFVCGCTATSCDQLSSERGTKVCGMVSDGCGKMLDCGNACAGADKCGGGPAANQCGCTPNLGACAGKECGTVDDGCGHPVQCGTSAGMCSANKTCNAQNTCACKTDLTSFCAGKCGPQQTPDGCAVACAPCATSCAAGDGVSCTSCQCPAGPTPGAPEVCRSGACCVPEAPATLCGAAVCGTRTNRCGQTVTCGTCGAGLACTGEGKCENPTAAALIGKYAVRSVGFGSAVSIVTRAEGLLLVDIYRDSAGKLVMREQSCWSGGYLQKSSCTPSAQETCENTVTVMTTNASSNLPSTTIELDITGTSDLPGAKSWVRGIQPPSQNAGGWRRGRPSYCPANGGPADATHPDFGPAGGGPRALGARKPWLNGAPCLCPAQEIDKRLMDPSLKERAAWCPDLTGAAKLACVEQWAQNHLPYSSGGEADASTVTDCRVVDDDLDTKPGTTAVVKANLLVFQWEATLGSASVTANTFWGAVDTSGAKRHWGVSQDHIGLESANVTCAGTPALCNASTGLLCSGYSGAPYGKENRVNPVEFVSLHDKTPPAGGWAAPGQPAAASCAEIFARRNDPGWFTTVSWGTRYPKACTLPGK